ncbi:MAG: mersacidin/lichenicidin family type 2 lantibiotic [Proteobacteria bacterium]|nr:mersacidin/lichenicidin family type 2 lantibiotic [Pseudomonadota bacterium]
MKRDKLNKIIRAWRDGEYYAELSDEQKAALPDNPAALPELDDDILSSVTGGCGWKTSSYCSPCGNNDCY